MTDLNDPQSILKNIELAINCQESLRGILTNEQIEKALSVLRAEYDVLVNLDIQSDIGIIDNRTVTTSLGDRSVLINGNSDSSLIIPGNNNQISITLPQENKKDFQNTLRQTYLHRVFSSANQLSLIGIIPSPSENVSQLSLAALYTGLMTLPLDNKSSDSRVSIIRIINDFSNLVILGEPGSGKSTLLNYIAMCLAGEALHNHEINIASLTSPTSDELILAIRENRKPHSQPWDHGPLIPVLISAKELFLFFAQKPIRRPSADLLWKFIEETLSQCSLEEYAPFLYKELLEYGGIILLDGLDEIPDFDQYRFQLKQIIEDFSKTFIKCRLIVSSRPYAYQKPSWKLSRFMEVSLLPFTKEQIDNFISNWFLHLTELFRLNISEEQTRAKLLKEMIFSNPDLRALSEKPLLLTLITGLYTWRGGSLPAKRELLYADTIDLLLDRWESPKLFNDSIGNSNIQSSKDSWLKIDRLIIRRLLYELAFRLQATQLDPRGIAEITESDLVILFMHICDTLEVNPVHIIQYLYQRAGIITQLKPGIFGFPHRTIQEYFAACYLAENDFPEKLTDLARSDPVRWQEVILLSGQLIARKNPSSVWHLVDLLCYQSFDTKDTSISDQWGAFFAGQILSDNVEIKPINKSNITKLKRVQLWLVHIIENSLVSTQDRILISDCLSRIGDLRFNEDRWFLPNDPYLGFVEIPGGPFIMGNDDNDEERPQHTLELPTFYIQRYPVTIAQFKIFINDSHYELRNRNCLNGDLNHPVVSTTWFDCLEYCNWLTRRLSECNDTPELIRELIRNKKWVVTLPSEAEWEKAARSAKGTMYPWGDDFIPDNSNTDELGLRTTTSVGCFPSGTNSYKLLDMSGNVWEWTRSNWGQDWKKPDYKYPYNPIDGREDINVPENILRILRGGSFLNNKLHATCSSRNRNYPYSINMGSSGFRIALCPSKNC